MNCHLQFKLRGLPARCAAAFICLAFALIVIHGAPEARAEEILIVRPLNNNQTEVSRKIIEFEVRISAFTPIVSVKINGVPVKFLRGPSVLVKRELDLDEGENVIEVEAATEFDEASREFEITYIPAGQKGKPERDHFQLVTVLGTQVVSNPLKVPSTINETQGVRTFLILIPRLDVFPSKTSTLRLQTIIARDRYNKDELTGEESALTQVTLSWIMQTGEQDSWTLGAGQNIIDLGYGGLLEGQQLTEKDIFLFSSLRFGLGEGAAFLDLALELKQQDFKEAAANPDNEEDAFVLTFKGFLQGGFWIFKSKTKSSLAITAADGKHKDKTESKASEELSISFGRLIVGGGIRIRRNDFRKADTTSFTQPVQPTETLTTFFFNTTLAFSRSWFLTAEYLTESQTSNVRESEYDNTSLSTSFIYIF